VNPVVGRQGATAELEVGLVHQGSGAQRALAILLCQLPARESAQILVDQGDHALHRGGLPLTRGPQEPCDLAYIALETAHERAR
jgi:hypothetical protein